MSEPIWKSIETLSEHPHTPGRIFVHLIGIQIHSGRYWHRSYTDLVYTRSDTPWRIAEDDLKRIMLNGDFKYIDKVYWAPLTELPKLDFEN